MTWANYDDKYDRMAFTMYRYDQIQDMFNVKNNQWYSDRASASRTSSPGFESRNELGFPPQIRGEY